MFLYFREVGPTNLGNFTVPKTGWSHHGTRSSNAWCWKYPNTTKKPTYNITLSVLIQEHKIYGKICSQHRPNDYNGILRTRQCCAHKTQKKKAHSSAQRNLSEGLNFDCSPAAITMRQPGNHDTQHSFHNRALAVLKLSFFLA